MFSASLIGLFGTALVLTASAFAQPAKSHPASHQGVAAASAAVAPEVALAPVNSRPRAAC